MTPVISPNVVAISTSARTDGRDETSTVAVFTSKPALLSPLRHGRRGQPGVRWPDWTRWARGHVVGFRRNVGDLRLTIDRIVAGTDDVMAWWSFTGIHVGPWLGRTPTGQEISGTTFSFFDLVDGRISRYRVWLHAVLDEPVVFDSSRPVVRGT
jgi:hypothetical protein